MITGFQGEESAQIWEDPLEQEMATCSIILAWRIPSIEELVGYTPWGHKE